MSWTCNHKHQVRDDHAGSYLLRTSLSDWDDERICSSILDVERSGGDIPQSEVGAGDASYISSQEITGGGASVHLGCGLSGCWHYLRLMLRGNGVHSSWNTVRNKLSTLHRLTTVMDEANGSADPCSSEQ